MSKLCIFVGMFVGGYSFWWGADYLGCEFFTAFLISGAGSILGCIAGWMIWRRFFE
jgi:hypothetical protein